MEIGILCSRTGELVPAWGPGQMHVCTYSLCHTRVGSKSQKGYEVGGSAKIGSCSETVMGGRGRLELLPLDPRPVGCGVALAMGVEVVVCRSHGRTARRRAAARVGALVDGEAHVSHFAIQRQWRLDTGFLIDLYLQMPAGRQLTPSPVADGQTRAVWPWQQSPPPSPHRRSSQNRRAGAKARTRRRGKAWEAGQERPGEARAGPRRRSSSSSSSSSSSRSSSLQIVAAIPDRWYARAPWDLSSGSGGVVVAELLLSS